MYDIWYIHISSIDSLWSWVSHRLQAQSSIWKIAGIRGPGKRPTGLQGLQGFTGQMFFDSSLATHCHLHSTIVSYDVISMKGPNLMKHLRIYIYILYIYRSLYNIIYLDQLSGNALSFMFGPHLGHPCRVQMVPVENRRNSGLSEKTVVAGCEKEDVSYFMS